MKDNKWVNKKSSIYITERIDKNLNKDKYAAIKLTSNKKTYGTAIDIISDRYRYILNDPENDNLLFNNLNENDLFLCFELAHKNKFKTQQEIIEFFYTLFLNSKKFSFDISSVVSKLSNFDKIQFIEKLEDYRNNIITVPKKD